MGVHTEREVVIECDRCGDTYSEAYTRKETMKLARKIGWSIHRDGSVKCWECKAYLIPLIERDEDSTEAD